jgi:hypothetical protein
VKYFITILILFLAGIIHAQQIRVSGRVYDMSRYNPLEAVTVLTTSGNGTISDSTGRYTIIVNENDSIWFSYLDKPTPKYPIKAILNIQNFEISLHVNVTELKQVQVMPRNYRLDSIQNRLDYAKAFNFQKPGISSSMGTGMNPSVGLDLNEFINMFKFRKNRRMLAFQERLLQEEEDRFIDYRFNRVLIIKLTKLHGEDLNDFIEHYRPSVEFIRNSTEYELQDYIKKSFSHYERYKSMMRNLNQNK